MTDWNIPFWSESVSRTVADDHFPIFKLLDDSAAKYPDQVYTIFNGVTKTYAQVRNKADRIANFLAAKNIGKGDKVAIFLSNIGQMLRRVLRDEES